MASKIFDNFEKETFTVLTPIGIKAIQDFNAADKDDAYIIIKGSTNLKYITPPNLLTEKAYYNSNPAIKSCDLDAIMYLQNHHTVASIEPKIKLLIDALLNSNFILRRFTDGTEHPGYGVFMVEAILAKYGLSIYLNHDNGEPVLITDVFSGKYPISFMKKNLIKHRSGYIMAAAMRKDDIGIYIFNKATGNLHVDKSGWPIVLSIIELTYILKKDDHLQIDTQLYYTQDALATPIYFQSPEWHTKYGGFEDSATFERVVPIPGIANDGNAAFLSLAYVIHELARGINYGFGPYKTKYDKRDKARVRLKYVLKLIKDNQISGLYTTYDKTFRHDNHFADFIDYLYNRYYDSVKNSNGDPMYDFENKKVFIPAGELNGVTRKQILDNVKLELRTKIQLVAEETALIQFNDAATNPTAIMILKYLTDNNYLDVIKSYTNGSADYATSMLGWYYTGDNAFLTHKLVNNLTVKEYHDRLTDIFTHMDANIFNAQLPKSYTLYKGVNLFNVVTSDGSYLRFHDIDFSKLNYIHNPIPSSTSFKIGVTSRFITAECCILRINMKKHHRVLILPNVHQVTGSPEEYEVILPPNAVFEITNVEYKYSKNIIGEELMKYNLVLVVDCNYLHPDDDNVIPGYKKVASPTPPPVKKPSTLFPPPAAVVPASPAAGSSDIPAKKPSTLFSPNAATPAQGPGKPAQGPGKPAQGPGKPAQGPGKPVQGPGKPAQGPGNPAQGPGNPFAGKKATGPHKPTPQNQHSHGSMSKVGKKKGLSGGRVPISQSRKTGSSSRKLFMVTTGSKSKGSRKSSARSSSRTHGTAVTYTVIFSDIFGAPCCTSGKADLKDKSAFEILDSVFSHPNAPTSRKLTPELQHMGLAMADITNQYMDTIRQFTEQHPEYEYLMQETNMNKLRETYESVIQLQTELTKTKHGTQITSVRKLTKNKQFRKLLEHKQTYTKKNLNGPNVMAGSRFKLANSPAPRMVAAAGAAG